MCFKSILLALLIASLVSACATKPSQPITVTAEPNSPLIEYALSLEGMPYRYGKATPEEGFDCSGLVFHVYQQQGITLPRTSLAMAERLPEVELAAREPGDLLFFQISDKAHAHVALYLGHEAFIHASSSATGKVTVSNLNNPYWQARLDGVRRPLRGVNQ